MTEPDDEERALRIELMNVQIEQGRLNIDKMRLEMKMENRKFLFQALGSLAAAMAAGAAIFGLILHLTGRL
jgi:hypothetical protein